MKRLITVALTLLAALGASGEYGYLGFEAETPDSWVADGMDLQVILRSSRTPGTVTVNLSSTSLKKSLSLQTRL